MQKLLHSVTAFPCNIGAWEALLRLCLPTGTPGQSSHPGGSPQLPASYPQQVAPQDWAQVQTL